MNQQKTIPLWFTAILCALTSGVVFLFDQWTKRIFFQRTSSIILINHLLETAWHRNFGITFDLPLPPAVITIVTILILICAGVALIKTVRKQRMAESLALSLVIAGALGNLVDRLTLGYVRDWILLFNRSAFNLADMSILIGIAWYLLAHERKNMR